MTRVCLIWWHPLADRRILDGLSKCMALFFCELTVYDFHCLIWIYLCNFLWFKKHWYIFSITLMNSSYLLVWWLHVGFICLSLVPKILFKGCPQELWIGDALFSGPYWDSLNPRGFGSSCCYSLGLPSCFISTFIPLIGPQSALTLYPESHLAMLGSILDCYIQEEEIFII